MRKSCFLRLFTILFLFFNPYNHLALSAHDNSHKIIYTNNKNSKKQRQQRRRLNGGNWSIHCVDLADFFYEIILSVSSFPSQVDCNDQEDAEIAAVLQKSINTELSAIPGTIKTKNKVCADPINDRRRLSGTNESFLLFTRDKQRQYSMAKVKLNTTTASHVNMNVSAQDERILLRHGQRSYIYVGGGRCRFCFYDNFDKRFLSTRLSTKNRDLVEKTNNKHDGHRNLMFINMILDTQKLPEAPDISMCDRTSRKPISFSRHHHYIKWTNAKNTTIRELDRTRNEFVRRNLFGLYAPGESFAVHLDMKRAMDLENNKSKKQNQLIIQWTREVSLYKLPVKEGIIRFHLYSFDLPTDLSSSTGMLNGDDPLIVFINGIKLDINLLISQPGTKTWNKHRYDRMDGTSFAGIKWSIHRYRNTNIGHGPEPDNVAHFQITAPLIVFNHKNILDIDFMIKPGAKAKHYAIGNLSIDFFAAHCNVTGMENTPFQDFQDVVESRLFHRMGIDVAHEFQNKPGHCLENKIPVVNVQLVEKQDRRDSNPQCG